MLRAGMPPKLVNEMMGAAETRGRHRWRLAQGEWK